MTAGRRGEIERNAFERSHEFTSFFVFFKGNELRGIFSLFYCVCVCVCVCVCLQKARSFELFPWVVLIFFSGKEEKRR